MYISHIFIMTIMFCLVQSQHIFSGMDELDQIPEAEISPGGDVNYSETPYVAAVFNSLVKFQTCTGFIIHRKFVVAAGYCVSKDNEIVNPNFVSVLAGVVDFRDHEMDQWRYAVSIHWLPQTYRGKSVLVIIKVNSPFFINFSCGVIKYKNRQFDQNGFCKAVSWRFHDRLNRLTLKSLVLKKYYGYVMNKTECAGIYKSNPVLNGLDSLEFVCMNFLSLPSDIDFDCMGADGSSIFCEENEVVFPIGLAVTYYGLSKCNRFDVPNVFLDLGAYSRWIDDKMSD